MRHLGILLVNTVVLLLSIGDAAVVDMWENCSVNPSSLIPSDFKYCNLSSIRVLGQANIAAENIVVTTRNYLCGTTFRNVTWNVNYTTNADGCKAYVVQNITRIVAMEPLPPGFKDPLPSAEIQRSTLDSLDPLDIEKPIGIPRCPSSMVYVKMSDGPAVKAGCGTWTIKRTWSLHTVGMVIAGACLPLSGGLWDANEFIQTITLVDNNPPSTISVQNIPGAYPKPRLAKPQPSVYQCNQRISPLVPQYFAHPDCASGTRVNLVQQNNLAPSATPNRVCGAQYFRNVWQATYSAPCMGSSARQTQLVTLLPVPPVITHAPDPVDITTSDSLSPDYLGQAEGVSPCGHDVEVTFVDQPPFKVACGTWTITRVWTVALRFDDVDCTLPKQYTATATQLITITDITPPQWVSQPPAEVRIPFFTNFQTEKSISSATEVGHPDMMHLGLTSHPITLQYQDSPPTMPEVTLSTDCAKGLAVIQRNWTISDICGNSQSILQNLIFEHPSSTPQAVQRWDPAQQWYYLAPGVEQLSDVCAAGKRVKGQAKKVYLTDETGMINMGCEGEGAWSAVGCQEIADNTQDFYIQDIHALPPFFLDDLFPPDASIYTTDSLDPDENDLLGRPTGASPCGTPFNISYHDAPPQQQDCGVWTIGRTWTIQPYYADCGGAEATYPDALTQRRMQLIIITDATAPAWAYLPPPEVQVPFFENYQYANPIPLANETAHKDMIALGLVSTPVKVTMEDSALNFTVVDEAHCSQGLASFERIWTAVDACSNSQSYVQRITLLHPPATPTFTLPWRPDEAYLAPADRDTHSTNRLFAYAPGVEQLADVCYPGKKVVGNGAVFTGLWETDHNCNAGRWTETACRLEQQVGGDSGVLVHPWAPFFVSFPENVTIFTNQSVDLPGPIGGSYCDVPFSVTHHDAPPAQQSCGIWTIKRTWKIQPLYLDCELADAKYANALTTTQVQVITIKDIFPPEFIFKPAQDIFVEFLEDYGPIATGVPQVEDKAINPEMQAFGLISYPITLEYNDTRADFFTGAASHVQGMAVVSRQWTTQDACGTTATWLQTIRIRNPNAKDNAGPLGVIGNFTVFDTEEVHLEFTNFSGSVGSNSGVYLTSTLPSRVVPSIVPDQEFSISQFSEKLISYTNRLFIDKLNACTGLKALKCTQPEQYSCQATLWSDPTTTNVFYDVAGNMILKGDGLVYNIFNDIDIDRWRYAPPKVAPLSFPKQIIRAEGFVILNIVYTSLDASKSMLRETVFQQRFPAGDPFVLYNLKNIPEQPVQNMVFENTKLTGSLLSQDAWNQIVFNQAVITGQVLAVNKKVTARNSIFQGQLFVPNFQVINTS